MLFSQEQLKSILQRFDHFDEECLSRSTRKFVASAFGSYDLLQPLTELESSLKSLVRRYPEILDYQNKINEQKYFLMVSHDQQKQLIRAIVDLDMFVHDLSAFYTLVQNQQGLREELVTVVTNIQHVLKVKQLVDRTVPLISSAREVIGANTAGSVESLL
ncbi:hypothetical protein P879_04898 [Paragonimus westermani]|uniref:Uncharacterized protein n=1 Tax=Paragonimus westermani TaxID=34504 RepID=A0A8T0DJY3_9TREM|nr:hypothetical protein P879_04898 [Paragonimus westermani]